MARNLRKAAYPPSLLPKRSSIVVLWKSAPVCEDCLAVVVDASRARSIVVAWHGYFPYQM